MTAEPWFAAYERAAFDEDGKLRHFMHRPPEPEPASADPGRVAEDKLTMPSQPSLLVSLLRLIGGRR